MTAPEDSEVRAEELVGRAGEEIDSGRRDVDRAVRGEVDRVDVEERPGRVRRLGRARDVVHRADGVRRPPDGHDFRLLADEGAEVLDAPGAVVRVEVEPADRGTAVRGREDPRRDVRVVVEARHDDLVPGLPVAREAPRHLERQRRHVRPEDDLLGPRRAEEVGHRRSRLGNDLVGGAARGKGPAVIRVRLVKVPDDPVGHLAGDLRAARVVEDHVAGGEGGETGADRFEIEHPERLTRTGQERFLSFASFSRRARSSSRRRFMSASRPAPFGA